METILLKYRNICVLLLLLLLLSGCSEYNYKKAVQDSTYDYGSQQSNDPKMLGPRMYGSLSDDPKQHDNKYMEYSSMLSREVTNINGVAGATVIITDKNAYVGLSLDWTATGTHRRGGFEMKEQDNTGTNEGVYNLGNGRSSYNNEKQLTPWNSYFTINDHNMISGELKQTIAAKIKNLSPQTEEVHISANMHFVNEMTDYAKEAWIGRPLEPWVQDFNVLVKYQFAGGNQIPRTINELKQQRYGIESNAVN